MNKISEYDQKINEIQSQISGKSVEELNEEKLSRWSDSIDPDSGENSKLVTFKFCKNDWQNTSGDYIGGISKGQKKIMMLIHKLDTASLNMGEDRFISNINFVK